MRGRGGSEEGAIYAVSVPKGNTFGGLLSGGKRGIQTVFIGSLRLPCIIREWHRSRAILFRDGKRSAQSKGFAEIDWTGSAQSKSA